MHILSIPIADIYTPLKRRHTLKQNVVNELAESILENGLQRPIHVRQDKERYVLVEGLHRLEACKALGETKIKAMLVGPRVY